MGKTLEVNTKDGYANVSIQQVKVASKVEDEKREITLDNAIMETVKYVVKGSDFAKIPTEFICQVEKALYGKRLVETFGEANMRKGKGKKDNASEISNLDKLRTIQDFNAAESSDSESFVLERNDKLRETLRQKGKRLISEGRRDQWLRDLRLEFQKRREFRKKQLSKRYKLAIFCTLAGEVWRGVDVSAERYREYLETIKGSNHYDKKLVIWQP
jgi:hypothetical protein